VTIDSGVLYGIFREISPVFSVSREEFSGENRKTYWKNIFDFKSLKTSKKWHSRGRSITMGNPYVYTISA